jgi:ABC-type Na+ efflux pump permease subunit
MIRVWHDHVPALDRRLPQWARRSDPIVRRHLGIYWKMLPLETDLLARLFGFQVVFVALSILVPVILPLVFTLLPVSLTMLPFVFIAYARTLVAVGAFATRMIVDEQRNNTLAVLMTTPLSLRHILFGKAAASVWRQIEDLSLILMAAVLLSLPFLGLQYAGYGTFEEDSLVSRLALVVGLSASIVRLIIEPFMIAALAMAVGAGVPARMPAILSLGVVGGFYFLLINLPRLLPLSAEARILVEFVLPVVLPLFITWASFRLAMALLRRD